jgi:putative peptide zinc metalloprotease protein
VIWQESFHELGDRAPTQDEAIRMLGTLHAADALQCDVPPDLAEMFARSQRREKQEGWRRFLNPVMIRFPLADPNRMLERWSAIAAPLFSRSFAVTTGFLILVASAYAMANLSELAKDAQAVLFSSLSFVVLGVAYPIMKLIHELAHGFAAKHWGSDVHEVGITLLLGMPIPYVDVSGAAVFPQKDRRIAVSLAGVIAEVLVASLALAVWWAVEPGLLRSLAAQVFWMGTLSTLLFNANPLVKFDGYFALVDALEMPNLQERSKAYMRYLAETYIFGIQEVRNPIFVPGEQPWLVGYAVAASIYRVFLVFSIAWLLAGISPFLGLALGVVWIATRLGLPSWRWLTFLLTNPRLSDQRPRALMISGAISIALVTLTTVIPIPHRSMAEGVVWPPERAILRPDSDGFVVEILAPPGTRVAVGQPLLRLREPLAEAKVQASQSRVTVLRREWQVERQRDRLRSRGLSQEIEVAELALSNAQELVSASLVRSPSAGIFLMPGSDDSIGRFVRKGALMGYVINREKPIVRVALNQGQITRIREYTSGVSVRVGAAGVTSERARIVRQIPSASNQLPSAVLSVAGGGYWATLPFEAEALRVNEPVFQLDVELEHVRVARVGERSYVRFEHGTTSLAALGAESLRDLLLSRVGG